MSSELTRLDALEATVANLENLVLEMGVRATLMELLEEQIVESIKQLRSDLRTEKQKTALYK